MSCDILFFRTQGRYITVFFGENKGNQVKINIL